MNHRDINWAQAFRELKDRPDKAKAGSEEARALWNEKAPSFARKPSRSDYINQLIGLLELDELKDRPDKAKAGSEEARALWNEKAPSFARKPSRSDYINQLIGLLELERSDSVLDVGCGSGTLAIPLAALGHAVVALDFSPVMLDELEQSASEESIGAKRIHPGDAADGPVRLPAGGSIATLERSWQQSWADIPIADITVSSRSLITEDLADSVRKLEEHARKRAFITVGAGSLPYRDHAILSAMGRSDEVAMDPTELICLVNYLFSLGRLPRISYISFTRVWGRDTREMLVDAVKSVAMDPTELICLVNYLFSLGRLPRISYISFTRVWGRDTREMLVDAVKSSHAPRTPHEEKALERYLAEHVICNEESGLWGRDTREMLVDAVKSSHAPRTPHEEKALERYLAEHVICNEESGQYELDRPRVDRWACVSWDVPNRCATRIC